MVSYGTTGPKRLVLTATLADGRSLTAVTTVNVQRLVTPTPDRDLAITASRTFQGLAGSGLAYVYLAPGHTALTNPAIVVEGFDLDNSMDWPVLYDLLNQENLIEDLRADGYDAVVLDFTEATEPIQRNAFVLTELLDQVDGLIAPGRTVALVGASMGGLVSRYALLWLENQGRGHHVRTFLSFDSPQTGRQHPPGPAALAGLLPGRIRRGRLPAGPPEHAGGPADAALPPPRHRGNDRRADPMFAAFLADLAALGGLADAAAPGGRGQRQRCAPRTRASLPGAQVILYEYRSLLADIDGNVWAVPDGGTQIIFRRHDQPDLAPARHRTDRDHRRHPALGRRPGRLPASMAQMDATEVPYGDIIALHGNHCFIPTVSALALDGVGPFHDIAGDPALMDRTPFDQVYYPAANQEHIAITPENKLWLMAEIEAQVTAVENLPDVGVTGPTLFAAVPNPFNPRTEISYVLTDPGQVDLRIHDLAGRLVRNLVRGDFREAGRHLAIWDGRDNGGLTVAAGTYFSRLQVEDQVRTGRMTLVK